MTTKILNPAAITSLADGYSFANGETFPSDSGWPTGSATKVSPATLQLVSGWLVASGAQVSRANLPLDAATDTLSIEALIDLGAAPGVESRLIEPWSSAYAVRLNQNTDGTLEVLNSSSAYIPGATTTGAYSGVVRLSIGLVYSTGRLRFAVYDAPTSTTPAETPFDGTGIAVGPGQFTSLRVGSLTSNDDTIKIGYVVVSDSTAEALGPLASDPPTIAVDQGAYVIDLRGSTVTGTPTFACTAADGLVVTQPVDGLFVVATDGTAHTLTFSVTDDGGTATTDVTIPATTTEGGDLVLIGGTWY